MNSKMTNNKTFYTLGVRNRKSSILLKSLLWPRLFIRSTGANISANRQ